mmetsp:Transcript_102755/g.249698  ORF Transcript_102755/g.249698 Transcript_102755/m.249698 type:complete len:203 (-) Transcript_102755:987-1595(-)
MLLRHERPQLVHVSGGGVWGHEDLTLHAPVREDRVEQALEQAGILLAEVLGRAIQASEERDARGERGRVGRPLLGRGEVKAVEVEVHTARDGNARDRCAIGEAFLPAREQAAGQGSARELSSGHGQRWASAHSYTWHHGHLKAHLDAAIKPVLLGADALLSIHNLPIPDLDLRVVALVPQLGDLRTAALIGLDVKAKPGVFN